MGNAVSDIIISLGEGISNIISSIADAVSNIISAIGEGVSNLIITISELPGQIIDLLSNLLIHLFVPEDDYFPNKIDNLKADLNGKIPYQEYQSKFDEIGNMPNETNPTGISSSIDLNNYMLSDKLTINMKKFIDFSIFSKYRDTWFVWVRVFAYILLILYWINEISKFFRGFSVSSFSTSHVNQNNQTGGGKE